VFISASEDNIEGDESHWTLPAPSQPGDFLTTSIHKVPSKSILKKTSSYGNFDLSESISSKRGSSSLTKNTFSLLSFDTSVKSGTGSAAQSRNRSDSFGLGLDLDSSSQSQKNTSFLGVPVSPILSVVDIKSDAPTQPDNADAAGSDVSASSNLSTSGNMKRSVSFSAVNVREYDRTIGDNPSCRSGPPLSLDWSYTKATTKNLDEFELERSSQRHLYKNKLHVNKYRRRNMLAFHWGHSQEEMKTARNHTKKLQRQRSLTQILLPIHMAHEVCIGIKSFVTKKSRSEFTRDDMSDLSLSTSKHIESLSGSNSIRGGNVNRSVHLEDSSMSQRLPVIESKNTVEQFHADAVEDA